MFKTSQATQPLPDGVLYVVGYYALIGFGFLLGSLALLGTVIPNVSRLAAQDEFYTGGVLALVIILAASVTAGAWMLNCAFGLWMTKRTARTATIVLSGVMAVVSVLSIPIIMLTYADGSMLGRSLIAVTIWIAVCSALSCWYLMRPSVKYYYETAAA